MRHRIGFIGNLDIFPAVKILNWRSNHRQLVAFFYWKTVDSVEFVNGAQSGLETSRRHTPVYVVLCTNQHD